MLSLPLISCVTITLNRLAALKEAVRCYCRQSYPNRELVIVTDGTRFYREAIARFIASLRRDDIRVLALERSGHTLGELRNLSLDVAKGPIVCQWDDDDLYHSERLAMQYQRMQASRSDACCLTDQLQLFVEARELYWVNWDAHQRDRLFTLIPGTLMMYKTPELRYPESGCFARAGEDSVLLEQAYRILKVAALADAGFLYTYVYHGANTFGEYHHRQIPAYYSVGAGYLSTHRESLMAALAQQRLPKPLTIKYDDGEIFGVLAS